VPRHTPDRRFHRKVAVHPKLAGRAASLITETRYTAELFRIHELLVEAAATEDNVIDWKDLAGEVGIDRGRLTALEQLADAVHTVLPKLRTGQRQGQDWLQELDALETALERLNPIPPPSS
jgi:hypothetical protein